jgi:hypothetical protein
MIRNGNGKIAIAIHGFECSIYDDHHQIVTRRISLQESVSCCALGRNQQDLLLDLLVFGGKEKMILYSMKSICHVTNEEEEVVKRLVISLPFTPTQMAYSPCGQFLSLFSKVGLSSVLLSFVLHL